MSISSILASGVKTIEYGEKIETLPSDGHSNKNIQDLVHLILNAHSFAEIHRACTLVSHQYGFNYFGFGVLTPTLGDGLILSHVYAFNTPWTQHYKTNGYMAIDPFALHCVEHTTPLLWSYTHPVEQFDLRCRPMVVEATEFGMRNMIQVPMHGTSGSVGGMRFSNFNDNSMEEKHAQAILPDLFYWCAFLQEAVDRVMKHSQTVQKKAKLSAREQEVLKWAACGKEACVISDILCISETTVLTHFKNAYAKLGVRTRQHAVAKALSLRMIYV